LISFGDLEFPTASEEPSIKQFKSRRTKESI
jgi:hypothetical protein